jgi:hypothetical protein
VPPSDSLNNLCRFAYTDFALARALDTRSLKDINLTIAYDCTCSYSVNIVERFATHLQRHTNTISKANFTIDSLHVHDHLDRCIYFFSTYYHDCMGHFTGVGAEQFWADNNQIGPQIRQMGGGSRQDKLTQNIRAWNFKKYIKTCKFFLIYASRYYNLCSLLSARQLAHDIHISKVFYVEKRDFFQSLSEVNGQTRVSEWARLDRSPSVNAKGEVQSVFRHSISKGSCPCFASIRCLQFLQRHLWSLFYID